MAAICREMGVSEPTFYRWKKRFAGMGVSEVRRLKQLEEENSKLKRLGCEPAALWALLHKGELPGVVHMDRYFIEAGRLEGVFGGADAAHGQGAGGAVAPNPSIPYPYPRDD